MISEHHLQAQCVTWFRLQYPAYRKYLMAFPNAAKRSFSLAARMKKEGMISGVPDLLLAVPNKASSGLFIEMKSEKGKLSDEQVEMIGLLKNYYSVEVINSFDGFTKVVTEYLRK